MSTFRIALLGAPCTGKTRLAHALSAHLSPTVGKTALVIDDNPACLSTLPDLPLAKRVATTANQPSHDLILLMGLDLGSPGDGARQSTAEADQAIRRALHQRGIGFKVVYGQGGERLRNALRTLPAVFQPAAVRPPSMSGTAEAHDIKARTSTQPSPRWVWACDKCSDPVCEHQLFTRLQAARAG